jgi:PDZ domain-containing protein
VLTPRTGAVLLVGCVVALAAFAVSPSGRWVSEGGLVQPASVAGQPVGEPSAGAILLTGVHERSVSRAEVVWGWLRGWDLHREGAAAPARVAPFVAGVHGEHLDVPRTAWLAALATAGVVPIEVGEVAPGSVAARGGLRAGDRIVAVDERAPTASGVDALLAGGWAVPLHVVRDGSLVTVELVPGPPWPQRPGGGAVLVPAPTDPPGPPPWIDTGTLEGASAGLGLALAYVDALTPGDLTGGRSVASSAAVAPTGGTIGGMGGLPHKVEAATRAGAEVFLVDRDDRAEAQIAAPPALEVVGVEGVAGAVAWLCAHGGVSRSCPYGLLRDEPATAS